MARTPICDHLRGTMAITCELARRRAQAVPRGVAPHHPVFAVWAKNTEIWMRKAARSSISRAASPCSMSAIAITR